MQQTFQVPPANESSQFFSTKAANITSKKPPTKKHRYLSSVVSGKPITEAYKMDKIREHENAKKPKSLKNKSDPQPGTSGTARPTTCKPKDTDVMDSDVALEEDLDTEVCCVCNLFTPQELRQSTSLLFVKWVQCTKCGHWVHLIYCTSVRVV
jgi:hypothetical protein